MPPFYHHLVEKIKTGIVRFSKIGLNEQVEPEDGKFIRYTNVTVALTALGFAIFILYSVYSGNYGIAAIQTTDLLCTLTVLWFNHRGQSVTARLFYLFLVNVFILFNSCYIGHRSGVSDFFYLSYVMPFLYFRIKHYKNIIAGIAMAGTGYLIYPHIYPYFTAYNLDPAAQDMISSLAVLMRFVLFGISMFIIAYYNFSNENDLTISKLKLQHARQLKRTNDDLEQFTYAFSHELKSPVRNVASFMQLLLKENKEVLNAASLEFVELSKSGAETMARQLDGLLAYSNIGKSLAPPTSLDLNETIRHINSEFKDKTGSIKCRVMAARPLPVLKNVNEDMMHHIFHHLISNGLKFNNNNEPQVQIDFKINNGALKFSIADNGIGIAPGYEEKIFQMFQRLNPPAQYEGTGIGLPVCRKIAALHKGDVWYESIPGEGSTFYFSLACGHHHKNTIDILPLANMEGGETSFS